MGLDWKPMGKPKPGFEERFNQIFRIIQGTEKQKKVSFFDRLKGKRKQTKKELTKEFLDNCITTYETIKAPRVGYDKAADEWVRLKYLKSNKSMSQEDFVNSYLGFYVIELAEELDGVPMYVAWGQDENVFRGKFLQDCKELIGDELYNEAWETKLASQTLIYGEQLLSIADKVASENNLLYLKNQRDPPDFGENSLESKVHILYAAAKWLIFYGKNGHGYEADF